MLTIPATIKTLFKTDGVRKNFRAHFPKGELDDITNADVVRESVRFTESACSQNTFRFGLAEDSMIEFETVGVGNMMGMTISCGLEIDTSSLSAAQISAIQADPGDGTLVPAADSDIGYGYYRVPLGVFTVTSCPRNHGAMTHRKVTAYGTLTAYNPFETAKLNTYVPEKDYKPNAYLLTLEMLGYRNKAGILAQGFTETACTEWQPIAGDIYTDVEKVIQVKTTGGATVNIGSLIDYKFGVYPTDVYPDSETFTEPDMLYAADLHGIDYSAILSDTAAALAETDISLAASGYGSWEELANDVYGKDLVGTPVIYPGVVYYFKTGSDWPTAGTLCPIIGDNDAIYPHVGDSQSKSGQTTRPTTAARFYMPWSIVVRIGSDTIYRLRLPTDYATITAYVPTATVPIMTLAVGDTAKETIRRSAMIKYPAYAHGGSFEPEAIPEGLLEIRGMFARLDRNGALDMFVLDPASPVPVVLGDYEECWWDEYDVSPIGTVIAAFLNGEEGETEAEIAIGTGRSVYDMTDNAVLKSLSAANAGVVSVLLGREFKTNARNTGFTPAELSMQGWPWMEAGDALRLTAEDETVVDTYAMQMTISGIQDLRADIVSRGGEIIGEV